MYERECRTTNQAPHSYPIHPPQRQAASGGNFPIFHHFSVVLFSIIPGLSRNRKGDLIQVASIRFGSPAFNQPTRNRRICDCVSASSFGNLSTGNSRSCDSIMNFCARSYLATFTHSLYYNPFPVPVLVVSSFPGASLVHGRNA